MKRWVVFSFDIPKSQEDKREDFYDELRKLGWDQVPGISTVWQMQFSGNTEGDCIKAAVKSVNSAAKAAGITKFKKVIFHAGEKKCVEVPPR